MIRPMNLTRRTLIGSALVTLFSPRPSVAEDSDGFVRLEARAGEAQILPAPAPATKIWGFGGQTPGPLLRVKLGQEIKARLVNRLDQPMALHWRGMRIANEIDGAAGLVQKFVAPGETRDFRFTPPDAGTYLYQPLIQFRSGEQLGRGLYGVVIVDDAKPLPADAELVLVLSDWRLDAKAQIVGDFDNPADALRQGRYGAVTSVNSVEKTAPLAYPPGSRLRLRLVSAANARIMALFFDGATPTIIAVDGQVCDPFEPVRHTIPIGPGARFDVLLDLPPQEGAKIRLILRGETELPDATVLEFLTQGPAKKAAPPLPLRAENPLLPAEVRLQGAKRLDLVIEGGWQKTTPAGFKPKGEELRRLWRINGRASSGLDGAPLFSVKKGQVVTLGLVNASLFPLVIHVQGHVVRLLHDLDDGWDPYWRDSVIAPEHKTKHIAFVADNPGKWLIMAAIMEHFSSGLAGWFEVT
jgi:FtsP/CotA-like multicopper oxidase with cupredoxin domain